MSYRKIVSRMILALSIVLIGATSFLPASGRELCRPAGVKRLVADPFSSYPIRKGRRRCD